MVSINSRSTDKLRACVRLNFAVGVANGNKVGGAPARHMT